MREEGTSPFGEIMIETNFPDNFKVPVIENCDGTTNSDDCLCMFEYHMDILKARSMARCNLFPVYLARDAAR